MISDSKSPDAGSGAVAPVGSNLYDRVAEETASVVIRRYSTSFGLAARLLAPPVRRHVENIYALVRVADEVVDGGAADAGLDPLAVARVLNDFERDTEAALDSGYSTNLVIHAFARSARANGFGRELTQPFFESMRMDLVQTEHDVESFETYVYGSAEVVGLMCLATFVQGMSLTPAEAARLEHGARKLGAAFQKVNFLRDLSADFETLGRSYFPGVNVESFSEAHKIRLLDDIDSDLRDSAAVVPLLPANSRPAVALAQGLFTELALRLRATPADRLVTSRVRVPNPVKLRIAAGALAGRTPRSSPSSTRTTPSKAAS
ncbi:phytoene/squalene synthase family protein [Frigoribacterium sp. CG_9.8]|uniref:phytoene/squalene synthase family protein n=1 Tax=Frigoribacterium sp. CG_9.8 TaxID=2787733 RepID=UPI0018C987EE|nr:phytoene/squalene synthase family protein [Frigoribacterium sp. CG_9.8]MBG6108616.1 phytoene/squalene synthetase [Frigoribacterium sp. CG_9.8]